MTREAASFEKEVFWKLKIYFTEMFHESLKTVSLEFNVKIRCEINVKLVFHEIFWKKNFTVYPSPISNKLNT